MQQQTYTTSPPRNKFNVNGLRAEDRQAVDESIDEMLKLVPKNTFATLIYHNTGQVSPPPASCTYKPFEIIMTDGTFFDEHMGYVPIYSRHIVVRLFIHEGMEAQQFFQQANPLLFDTDSTYSKQVMSITPN